jgi:hypothetical protein
LSQIDSWLIDMDGVLVREEHPIVGCLPAEGRGDTVPEASAPDTQM